MHVVYFCTIQEHQKRHTLISQTRDVPMHVWLHVYNGNKSHCLAWILIRLRGCGHWPFDLCAPENVGRLVTPAKKLEDTIRLAELVIEVLQQNEEHHAEVSVPEYVRASVLLITWLLSNITLMKSYYIIFFFFHQFMVFISHGISTVLWGLSDFIMCPGTPTSGLLHALLLVMSTSLPLWNWGVHSGYFPQTDCSSPV